MGGGGGGVEGRKRFMLGWAVGWRESLCCPAALRLGVLLSVVGRIMGWLVFHVLSCFHCDDSGLSMWPGHVP